MIEGDAFRHPLDLENTQVLRAIPGMENVVRGMVSPVTEQLMVMENVGSSLLVDEHQYPSIHRLHREAMDILGVEDDVRVYVRLNPVPNAYTLAVAGGKAPFIVLHTALVELLSPAELQSVIAHELGHLKCDHGVYLAMANLLAASASALPMGVGNMISAAVEEGLYRWLRSAELSCDRAALVVARDPKVVASALMKLAGGVVPSSMPGQAGVGAELVIATNNSIDAAEKPSDESAGVLEAGDASVEASAGPQLGPGDTDTP